MIWVGSFQEETIYHPSKRKSYTEVYSFVRIPKNVYSLEFSKNLTELQSQCNKTVLLLANSTNLTEELHYGLYEILDNFTVTAMTIESSR